MGRILWALNERVRFRYIFFSPLLSIPFHFFFFFHSSLCLLLKCTPTLGRFHFLLALGHERSDGVVDNSVLVSHYIAMLASSLLFLSFILYTRWLVRSPVEAGIYTHTPFGTVLCNPSRNLSHSPTCLGFQPPRADLLLCLFLVPHLFFSSFSLACHCQCASDYSATNKNLTNAISDAKKPLSFKLLSSFKT